MKQLTIINPENVSDKEAEEYLKREAVRAVILDKNNLIALLYVTAEKYYKLPGGGVEDTEDFEKTLRRECREEAGCEIDILKEIGSIVEYRKIFGLKQTSYCYLAKIKGKKGSSSFTKEESQKGFKSIWLSYDKALKILSKNLATSFEGGSYIVPRDIFFLKEAKKHLDNLN